MDQSGITTLVLGGARSGKSEVAEQLVARQASRMATDPMATYVATGALVTGEGADADWGARVAAHQARRPTDWDTVELDDPMKLAPILLDARGAVLVDSLGTWIVALPGFGLEQVGTTTSFLEALESRRSEQRPTVVVSEEVGLGVHPPTEVGSRFRDALGTLNRQVAEVSDQVLLVVAGRVLLLERP